MTALQNSTRPSAKRTRRTEPSRPMASLTVTGPQIFYTILGMAIAFGVSVYSIQFLMGYVRRHDFKFFGYYRIILGVVVLAYFGITALAA